MAKDRMLILHFVDGNKLSFDFPEQTEIAAGKQIKIEDLLKGNHLVVEVEGSLLIFPVHSSRHRERASTPPPSGCRRTPSAAPSSADSVTRSPSNPLFLHRSNPE